MHADVEFPFANYRIDRKNRIDFTKSEATRWECCYSKFSLRHGYDVDNDRICVAQGEWEKKKKDDSLLVYPYTYDIFCAVIHCNLSVASARSINRNYGSNICMTDTLVLNIRAA